MIAWTEPRHGEQQAQHAGRVLHINIGSPNHFCFSDGEYLGSKLEIKSARKLCESGKKEGYVMEFENTEEHFKRLKPKPPKREWSTQDKDTLITAMPDERVPGRIRTLDKVTHSVYRNGSYLGSEESLEKAKMRFEVNELSGRNRVMRLWEQTHPGELPPGLQLTDAERAAYWAMHPPRQPSKMVGRGATLRPNEDAATRKLREGLEAEGGGRKVARGKRADAPAAPQGTIRVKVGAAIPKKPGSSAHGRWSVLWKHDGKTVAEYAKAGGNLTTLANAVEKGLVSVEENK